jgi:hypothetical protein
VTTTAIGWEATELAWATSATGGNLPTLNRVNSSDFNDGKANGIATLNTILNIQGGVYQIGSGGAANVVLGNTATQIAIGSPKVDVWAISSRVKFTGAAFTAGKLLYAISIFDLAGNGFAVIAAGSTSATVFQARHFYAGGVSTQDFPCGSVGTLGATTAPVGAFFKVRATFDGTSLKVYFNTTLALTLTGAQLTNMVTGASYLYLGGNDAAVVYACDGMFVATTEAL